MDNSQLETSTNNALLEIQRAQRVLDETELKMKRFRKEKQSASKNVSFQFKSSPVPDLKQYLSYLINQENEPANLLSSSKQLRKLESTTQIRSKADLFNPRAQTHFSEDRELNNYKKTEKAERLQYAGHPLGDREHINSSHLDLRRHTQEQLEKSHIVRLERIQAMYKQQFETLDQKIQDLLRKREKIKKDKVLLMRDNEELQEKIEVTRAKRISYLDQSPQNVLVIQMRSQLLKLQKKLAKIQLQNNKIIKRKQELETNMRVCIRNSKDHLASQIEGTRLRQNKSKSNITYKCPYH